MKRFMQKSAVLTMAIAFALSVNVSKAQTFDLEFMDGGVEDGLTYLEAYVAPWANAFGAAFNGGWYNTAKPHKLLGFDITLMVNVGLIPEEAKSFDVTEQGFNYLSVVSGGNFVKTIAGKNESGPTLAAITNVPGYGDVTLSTFNSPGGSGLGFIPLPMAQIGLGLPLGSDVTVRYIPNTPLDDATIGLWGVGLKHSIMQYLPGDKLLPFDVSVFGAYSKLSINLPVNMEPDSYLDYTNYAFGDFDDQEMDLSISAVKVSLIASTTLPVINVFGGVGYSKTLTNIEMIGDYPLPSASTTNPGEVVYVDEGVTQIPGLEFENLSGLSVNVGLRLKLGVLTIHGAYTKANYNVVSGGLGISFR